MKKAYIEPAADTISVSVRHQILEVSQITIGGGGGSFDAKEDRGWEEDWDDDEAEDIW